MARPISLALPPRDARAELAARLENAPAEHAEAVLAAYEVLQGLHDRGVLELARGALGSGDKVLEIGVEAIRSPEALRSVRNVVLLANMLGAIDPEQLGSFTRAVPPALQATARQPEPPGIWRILSEFLWNSNIRRALFALSTILETIGGNLAAQPAKTQEEHAHAHR